MCLRICLSVTHQFLVFRCSSTLSDFFCEKASPSPECLDARDYGVDVLVFNCVHDEGYRAP
jgi:hypothetical protein